jgi:hypothetical protein
VFWFCRDTNLIMKSLELVEQSSPCLRAEAPAKPADIGEFASVGGVNAR